MLTLFLFAACPAMADAQGNLAIDPGSYEFGSLQAGDNETAYLEIWNQGLDPLTLGSIGFTSHPGPFMLSDNGCTSGLLLEPDWGCELPVTFIAPWTRGDYGATVLVETDDGTDSVTASLTGSAYLPGRLIALPGTVDFGTLASGTPSRSQAVTVRNDGDTPETVVGVELVPTAGGVGLALDAGGCVGTILPGSECGMVATFHPPVSLPMSFQRVTGVALFNTADGSGLRIPLRASVRLARTLGPRSPRIPASRPVQRAPRGIDYGSIEQQLVGLAESVPRLLRGGPRRALRLPSFRPPTAGRLSLRVHAIDLRKRVRLVAGTLSFDAAVGARLRFKLGPAATELLRQPRRTRVRVTVAFTARATGEKFQQSLELRIQRPVKALARKKPR